MSANEIESKAMQIKELERLIEEAEAQAESLKDEIKAEMTAANTEELRAGAFKITWKAVTSSRLDSKKLKALFSPEDLAGYTITTTSKRFLIA